MPSAPDRILVIKLGALGDVVQALGPMKAIRDHHPGAHITLLTTAPYVDFLRASALFDDIWVDDRPKAWQLIKLWRLARRLNKAGFAWVYDLQTSSRSSRYVSLFSPKPQCSGIAKGCSHPHDNPNRNALHTLERQADQLARAGLASVPAPDLSWANADTDRFALAAPFALLVPGGAPHRPDKRWPVAHFAALANRLADTNIVPVLLGRDAEAPELDAILQACPRARDLRNQTTMLDIAALARQARVAVGNDTGPMHLIAAAGCPSVVLYSHASDPALCAQRGPDVAIIRKTDLADVTVDEVFAALDRAIS